MFLLGNGKSTNGEIVTAGVNNVRICHAPLNTEHPTTVPPVVGYWLDVLHIPNLSGKAVMKAHFGHKGGAVLRQDSQSDLTQKSVTFFLLQCCVDTNKQMKTLHIIRR